MENLSNDEVDPAVQNKRDEEQSYHYQYRLQVKFTEIEEILEEKYACKESTNHCDKKRNPYLCHRKTNLEHVQEYCNSCHNNRHCADGSRIQSVNL